MTTGTRMQADNQIAPWYKQFWAWFVIAILAFAVFIGLGLLFIAMLNPDSLVRDNYYTEGKAINMYLGRDHMARDLNVTANFDIDEVTGDISMQLQGDFAAMPRSLTLDLISPAHASKDRAITLRQIKDNTYTGQLEQQIEGRRYIELSDPDKPGDHGWRVTGELQMAPGQQYQITAQ
tara:strand:+ start:3932 stop:4465 length:534 start_codon:yes stop_codon:yes gene_type:complete